MKNDIFLVEEYLKRFEAGPDRVQVFEENLKYGRQAMATAKERHDVIESMFKFKN